MEIQKLSNIQPTFSGYVDKSVKKHINKVVMNQLTEIFSKDSYENSYSKVQSILGKKKDVSDKLEGFMKKLASNVALKLEAVSDPEQRLAGKLFFQNVSTNKSVIINSGYCSGASAHNNNIDKEIFINNYRSLTINPHCPLYRDLEALDKIVDSLNSDYGADKIDMLLK